MVQRGGAVPHLGKLEQVGKDGMAVKIPWARPFLGTDEEAEVVACIRSGWIAMGRRVQQLEERLAALVGSRHAVAVSSGTAALDIALKVLGIGPGNEVIVPAFGYIATANAVLYQHATPIFADVDPVTYTLDPKDVECKVTPRTRCLVPIDYAGQGAEYARLREIASARNLFIVEDGAPGLGGRQGNTQHCALGDIGVASFHSAKIFTTAEGGMLFTDCDDWARTARIIRSQGEDPSQKYHHPVLGHNYRMTDLHAAVGLAQVQRFEEVLVARARAAERYMEGLRGQPEVVLPKVRPGTRHAWFLFPILVPQRDCVRARMAEEGIETNVSWPLPLYRQESFRMFATGVCPVTEDLCRRVLCLPLYHGMTAKDQDLVVTSLRKALKR